MSTPIKFLAWMIAGLIVILCIMAYLAGAHAQSVCAERDEGLRAVAREKVLIAQGVSLIGYLVQVWASEKDGSYTIITVPPGRNMICFLDMGTDWEAVKPGRPT